jgi:hypothetical protein
VIRIFSEISLFLVLVVLWCPASAVAGEPHPASPAALSPVGDEASAAEPPGSTAAQQLALDAPSSSGDRVRLVADQKAGVLRVVIDGKSVAWFDASGLHVNQNIEYGGTLSDTGSAYLEKRAGDSGAP